MGFKPASGIKGRVFIPEETPRARKKHDCPDCYRCQQCGDDRCQLCRSAGECHAAHESGAAICCDRDGKPQTIPAGCHRRG